MQSDTMYANIPITNGWMRCPRCRKKIARVLPSSSGRDIVLHCRHCRIDWVADIKQPVPKRPDTK